MLARIVLVVMTLFTGSVAHAEEFGPCQGEVRMLLSQGGAISKVTDVQIDRLKLKAVYTYEFGTTWTSYTPKWDTLSTQEARAKAVAQILAQMDDDAEAAKAGRIWYLVVNRGVFAGKGLNQFFKYSSQPNRTTEWRPYVMAITSTGSCAWTYIDLAIHEDEMPKGIRDQLR